MNNTSWYRVAKDITLKSKTIATIYRTVFETSDYALSNKCVEWCKAAMDDGNMEKTGGGNMKFVELKKRSYIGGGYCNTGIYVNIDDISRVVECKDDFSLTNIVTKDGKIATINEKYSDVVRKIMRCDWNRDE